MTGTVIIILLITWIIYDRIQREKAKIALMENYHSEKTLRSWLSDHPEPQSNDLPCMHFLVNYKISAYEQFLKTHPFISRDEKYDKWLHPLLIIQLSDTASNMRIPRSPRRHDSATRESSFKLIRGGIK